MREEPKVVIELTLAQIDALGSNRISKMKPVVEFIMKEIVPKDEYLRDNCEYNGEDKDW